MLPAPQSPPRVGVAAQGTAMWDRVGAGEASHLSLGVCGHGAVVPPPGCDSKTRAIPEVKE